MKKNWVEPGIISEEFASTAFNAAQGEDQDGEYRDWQTCNWIPVYAS